MTKQLYKANLSLGPQCAGPMKVIAVCGTIGRQHVEARYEKSNRQSR